ncbi:ATP-grasp domain-containing protein [Nocardioides dongxiaopingii]|uniref:ATP-grasp domain-containing protein n=1 Tax=Nocardioides dongxiaopingii TaxID=2576036 RepID=UPI001484FF20|nr:hypothetical protein [Nocardioides dongxiaopingii]
MTSAGRPLGEPGHDLLDAALAGLGLSSRWAVWDDPSVDWGGARLVAVRSTWDYQDRRREFLAWAERIGPALVNGAAAFRWNTDKSYLLDLAGHTDLPVVPSALAGDADAVRAAVERFGTAVVKPQVGASAVGVEVVADAAAWRPGGSGSAGPWLVQPLVDSVHTEGEQSVFVLDGRPVSQAVKRTGGHDVRVHERHGGTTTAVPLDAAAARLAVDAVAAASARTGADLVYARVDLLHRDGRLVVSEVEVTEPGLYLPILPVNATALAAALATRL